MESQEIENKIFLCKIIKIGKTFFEVITSCGKKGVVFIDNVSDYYVKDLNEIVQLDNILYLVLKEYDGDRLILSFKKNRSDFLRTPFEFSIKKTKENFKNLFNFTNEEIEKWKK